MSCCVVENGESVLRGVKVFSRYYADESIWGDLILAYQISWLFCGLFWDVPTPGSKDLQIRI